MSAAVANTSALRATVGAPPWGRTNNSGLASQICSAMQGGIGGVTDEYVLPTSLLRVGRVETAAFSERVVGYNASALHVLPTVANLLTNLRLRELLPNAGANASGNVNVSAALHPLSFSSLNVLISSRTSSLMSISMFVVFASVPAFAILMFTVGEIAGDRGLGMMQVLRLSGVRFAHFWTARLLLDLPQYLLVIVLFCIVLQLPLIPVRPITYTRTLLSRKNVPKSNVCADRKPEFTAGESFLRAVRSVERAADVGVHVRGVVHVHEGGDGDKHHGPRVHSGAHSTLLYFARDCLVNSSLIRSGYLRTLVS